jgi:hypothetical protein
MQGSKLRIANCEIRISKLKSKIPNCPSDSHLLRVFTLSKSQILKHYAFHHDAIWPQLCIPDLELAKLSCPLNEWSFYHLWELFFPFRTPNGAPWTTTSFT